MTKNWNKTKKRSLRLGRRGERVAAILTRELGCELLVRNYNGKHGEIDIVARDGETLVFIEVKTRRRINRARPSEAVGAAKKQNIIATARQYMREIGFPKVRFRFDIIEIVVGRFGLKEAVAYPNAFSTEFNSEESTRFPVVYPHKINEEEL